MSIYDFVFGLIYLIGFVVMIIYGVAKVISWYRKPKWQREREEKIDELKDLLDSLK